MSVESWVAYLIACVVLTVIPGPSVMLVIGQSLTRGRAAAMMGVLGTVVGSIALLGLSFAGVGAVLAASALLFQLVKWAGVFYLAWLGIEQIRAARGEEAAVDLVPEQDTAAVWSCFRAGALTAVLNPKSIVFYMAFLAQFIAPDGNLALQLALLTLTSSLVVVVVLGCYALVAARMRTLLGSRAARRRAGYAGGGFMIGGSAFMAVTR
ncbi:LysE family translocator [uncultured Martelella sp.]|uniref:LysE family translocator n=1 Tax=uncultured Martelella sp. TaxID=392331 RepID=UPI0029C7C4A2|nr:LysE family translocator [uncultured Martelella sp.]